MPNYNYVVDSHYKPYSMQEMLVPFLMYKEESDKREQEYLEYADKMDAIKQAAEEAGGEAAQIYNTYNNDYQKAFSNYLNHGLGMGNKRDWLNLKRRYRGEIGKLEDADKVLKEIQKDMRDKGPSYLWGDEAPTLNNILNNSSYMNYGISTDDLYKRGVQSATASSTGIYNNPRVQDVTKYYQEIIQSQGYSPAVIAKFRDDLEAIPEFNDAINNIMMETGAEDHLSGIAYGRAKQSIINGLIDGAGAAYKESRSIKDNPGVLTAAQAASNSTQRRGQNLTALQNGIVEKDGKWQYDKDVIKEWREAYWGQEDQSIPPGYKQDPNNPKRIIKDPNASTSDKKQESQDEAKQKALLELKNDVLANNRGFDVTFGSDRHHYDWIGGISKHGEKWYSGAIGEDNPGHNFPRALGWGSTSNVENWKGNFSAEGADSPAELRILGKSEINSLMQIPEIANEINTQLYNSGYFNDAIINALMDNQKITRDEAIKILQDNQYKYTNDVQVAAVSNEWPNRDQDGYLVAVRTK